MCPFNAKSHLRLGVTCRLHHRCENVDKKNLKNVKTRFYEINKKR